MCALYNISKISLSKRIRQYQNVLDFLRQGYMERLNKIVLEMVYSFFLVIESVFGVWQALACCIKYLLDICNMEATESICLLNQNIGIFGRLEYIISNVSFSSNH